MLDFICTVDTKEANIFTQRQLFSLSFRLTSNVEHVDALKVLEKDLLRRKAQLHEMEQTLPKQNGLYLKIILGNVNVSILNKNDKYVLFKLTGIRIQSLVLLLLFF